MRTFFTATAALEAATGLALLASPSTAASLLLGDALDSPTAVTVGRITGAALLALGVGCWLARNDWQSRAARGLIAAMLVYNVVAVALLAHAGLGSGLGGGGLWTAVVLHGALAVWCATCLRRRSDPAS